MKVIFRKGTILLTLFLFFISALFAPAANTAMVPTGTFMKMNTPGVSVSLAQVWLDRQDVQDRLQAYGVNPDEAKTRLAALSDAEILQLQNQLDDLPAGGGAIEVIGIVFLVILILELVGLIDIFKKI